MPRVCVIGSGIAGLAAARAVLASKHEVVVFERYGKLGGCWNPEVVYPGATTQDPGEVYVFSEFAPLEKWDPFPTAPQIYSYLLAYAKNYDLIKHIRFNTEVTGVQAAGDGPENGWIVNVKAADGKTSTEKFDFLMVCTGTFSSPNIPDIPGAAEFRASGGVLLHTSELAQKMPDISAGVAGRTVVVLGFGKSALDVATMAATAGTAKSVKLVHRSLWWCMPKKILSLIPFPSLFLSRFGYLLLPSPYEGTLARILRFLLTPLTWFAFRAMEQAITAQQGLRRLGMVPPGPLNITGVTCLGAQVEPDGFYNALHRKVLSHKQASIIGLGPKRVDFDDGTSMSTDTLILGTGYKWPNLPFLPPSVREQVLDQEGGLRLHRKVIPINVPNLAFIGYASSLATLFTNEMSARYATAYLDGRVRPARSQMEALLKVEREHAKRWYQDPHIRRELDGPCVAPYQVSFVDEMCREMGVRRKVGGIIGFVRDWMDPWDARFYKDCK